MSEAKHTPGPWWVVNNWGGYHAVEQARPGDKVVIHHVDREADAYLAAAAPDLLEAAKEIEAIASKWCYPCPDKPDSSWAKLERLRAAIARAEGRTA